jgi:hypothetical protein
MSPSQTFLAQAREHFNCTDYRVAKLINKMPSRVGNIKQGTQHFNPLEVYKLGMLMAMSPADILQKILEIETARPSGNGLKGAAAGVMIALATCLMAPNDARAALTKSALLPSESASAPVYYVKSRIAV